ncbi:MAG TPA: helix-hairpin-helix domain-containing protein [Anaerolineae bacterium]|nr:helix-hairpin-helix domain-containing protein [Anaerolineae bacterium]HMR65603.1 helix-hairpin-helix domain-containing protein [Anaerolineae bacterium]
MDSTWLDRNRHLVFGLLAVLAVSGVALFYWRQPAQAQPDLLSAGPTEVASPTVTLIPTPTSTPAPVRVYVTGAVAKSDVYYLPAGSIIKDAILAAGGFTAEANPERINQALELIDQQQIHVPRLDEENPPPPVQGGAATPVAEGRMQTGIIIDPAPGGLINLNTATTEQLDSLPGIGPAIAQRIIDYRESVGGFTTIEEITQVSGIGEATFAKIKASITVQ